MLDKFATRATDAIHCAYFFEFVSRQITELEGYPTWDIVNSKFKKQIESYHFNENDNDNYDKVEVWLIGEIDIKFSSETGHIFFKRTDFGTIMNLVINEQQVLEYDFKFYPEESGLNFEKFIPLSCNLVPAGVE